MRAAVSMQPLIAPTIEISTVTDTSVAPIDPRVRSANAAPTRLVAAICEIGMTFR